MTVRARRAGLGTSRARPPDVLGADGSHEWILLSACREDFPHEELAQAPARVEDPDQFLQLAEQARPLLRGRGRTGRSPPR